MMWLTRAFHNCKPALLYLVAAVLCAAAVAGTAAAGMTALPEDELALIRGQAGVTIYTQGQARVTIEVMKFSDTDHDPVRWLEFRNFVIDDGAGGYFRFDTYVDYLGYLSGDPQYDYPITIDVATVASGNTYVFLQDSHKVMPRWYHADDVVFCDQSLGSLHLDALRDGPSLLQIGPHADGTIGVDFEYRTVIRADALRYTYNTTAESLNFAGFHLAYAATGASDDPANPATWEFTGADNRFRIGDIAGGSPATIDVGSTETIPVKTAVVLNLPMQGCLRVENVNFGGNDFGPIAIDGIRVHRLTVQVPSL